MSSCSNDDTEVETQDFNPGDVLVGIKSGTSINSIFDFINQFDQTVDNINSLKFTSDLSSDNLQYVLDFLNEKAYTNRGGWFVSGYLHHQTNQITIFPRLYGLNNLGYQNDWLTSMDELELIESYNIELNSGVIHFNVPIGSELEWERQFENYSIVEWAELNRFVDIDPLADDNGNTNNCDIKTIESAEQYVNAAADQLEINSLSISDNCLKINFSSGGCSGDTWQLKLIDSEDILESIPPQRNLRLSLKNEELCEAFITKDLTFDISNLQVDGNQVQLNITNSDESIVYEY